MKRQEVADLFNVKVDFVNRLKEHKIIQYKNGLYNTDSVNIQLIEYIKKYTLTSVNLDKQYKSKYLKVQYWLEYYTIEETYKKIKYIRRYKDFFEYKKVKGFLDTNYDKLIEEILTFKYKKISDIYGTTLNIKYYLYRGYTEQQAIKIISKKQTKNSQKKLKKYSKQDFKDTSPKCVDYWLLKGYTEQEAKEKISNSQRLFSLKICIEKYGEEEGTTIFNKRQENWQKTLNAKSIKEIDSINKSKGTYAGTDIPLPGSVYNFTIFKRNKVLAEKPGCLYYFSFKYKNKKYYKIGISRSLKKRIGWFNSKLEDLEVLYIEHDTIYNCFVKEQLILTSNKAVRTSIKNISTEIFKKEVEKVLNL